MCYNYSLNTVSLSLEKRFKASLNGINFNTSYHVNGFNHPKMPIVTSAQPAEIQLFEWGLIPANTNTNNISKIRNYTLNARSETIFKNSSFKNAVLRNRCLIPASGFFEFQHSGKSIIPYFIFLSETEIFSFAGIWDTYTDGNNNVINSYSIITKKADNFMSEIHNTKLRMPVILPSKNEKDWLRDDLFQKDIRDFFHLKNPEMKAYTVTKKITDKNYNSNIPEILNEIKYPGTQQKIEF